MLFLMSSRKVSRVGVWRAMWAMTEGKVERYSRARSGGACESCRIGYFKISS